MTDGGTAWVAVKPLVDKAGWGDLGKKLAIAAPLVAAGAAIFKIGESFDQMKDTIVVGTGASGKALKALEDSAKRVGKTTPSSFADIGTAIADVNTRLGLTGKPLETVTKKLLNMSRITGTDLQTNIAASARVMGDWGIAVKDQAGALDKLFFTSQSTGIGVDKLAQQVVQFGAPMRQFGFSFEESISLMGKWEKEGVNSNAVLAGLKIGLGEFSKAGKDPQKALRAISTRIKEAGSAGKANELAIAAFGQRAGPDMAAAIREGRFEIGDMVKALGKSGGAIDKADKGTRDWRESLSVLRNKAMVFIEPLATKMFNAINKGADWLNKTGIPAIRKMGKFVQNNNDAFIALAVGVGTAVLALTTISIVKSVTKWIKGLTIAQYGLNAALRANPIGVVVTVLALLAAGFVFAYKRSSKFRAVVDAVWAGVRKAVAFAWNKVIKPVFKAWHKFFTDVLFPVVRFLWTKIVKPIFAKVGDGIKFYWSKVIKPVFSAWKKFFTAVLFPVLRFLWNQVVKPVFKGIGNTIEAVWKHGIKPVFNAIKSAVGKIPDAFRRAKDGIGRIWAGLKAIAKAPINFIIGTVYNNGIRKLVNKLIPGELGPLKKLATGGVLPGYTPGRDVHDFYSPTAGRLALSGGEAIMRPEFTRRVGGKRGVDRLNKMARSGMAFAGGGVVWPTTGRSISTYAGHDGVDINGPGEDYGNPIFAFRKGTISYVGSGRGYGAPAIFERTSVGEVVYGHASSAYVKAGQAVKAGQVIGRVGSTGNSTGPHLHFGFPGGSYSAALAALNGASSGGGLTGGVGTLGQFFGSRIGDTVEKIKELGAGLKKFAGNPLGNMGVAVGKRVIGAAVDKVQELGSSVKGFFLGSNKTPGTFSIKNLNGVQQIVAKMAAARGWTGDQWNALNQLVNRESGWNPTAANPTSSARGLFQKMTSIHGPLESTIAGQAKWGLNYIAGRYGNPSSALAFHDAHGYYKNGGVYDNGGQLQPGLSAIYNGTRKPEKVLTDGQFSDMHTLATRGGGGEMRITSGWLEVSEDGLVRLIDGRIDAGDMLTAQVERSSY